MLKITKLFTLVLSFIAVSVFASETPQISQQELLTAQISQQELLTAQKAPNHNIVVLDVRSEDKYNHGHLAGAINISYDEVEGNLSQLAQYKGSTVVVYCRSGRRAGIAEKTLAEDGFNDLRHLTGDMNGWLEAKLPVVSSGHSH